MDIESFKKLLTATSIVFWAWVKFWLAVALRALLAMSSLALSTYFGVGLVLFLSSSEGLQFVVSQGNLLTDRSITSESLRDSLVIVTSVLGGGIVLAAFQQMAFGIEKLTNFITESGWEIGKLTASCTVFFLLGAGVTLVFESLSSNPPTTREAGVIRIFLQDQEKTADFSGLGFLITFKEDATLESMNATLESISAKSESEDATGLTISPADIDLLGALAETFERCLEMDGERGELSLIGMASSSQIGELGPRKSNQKNMELANLRAEVVKLEMERQLSPDLLKRLDIEVFEWTTFEDMIQARRFRDTNSSGEYDSERARLTRRVEIRIVSAGGCDFDLPITF